MKIVFATRNEGKKSEIRSLLAPYDVEVASLDDYSDIPDIEEDGITFEDNARIKARTVSELTGLPALADDSGLEVDALDGAPGVHSARFAPTTAERNSKLLDLMKDIPDDQRHARFICSLVFIMPDGTEWKASGVTEGIIAREPVGDEGFGYDPIFYYPPLTRTFGEIPQKVKNAISHRGKAMKLFVEAVRKGQLW